MYYYCDSTHSELFIKIMKLFDLKNIISSYYLFYYIIIFWYI